MRNRQRTSTHKTKSTLDTRKPETTAQKIAEQHLDSILNSLAKIDDASTAGIAIRAEINQMPQDVVDELAVIDYRSYPTRQHDVIIALRGEANDELFQRLREGGAV